MDNFSDMMWIELRKALRSRMPLFTALGSLFMPLGIGFLIFLAKNPQLASQLGLVSAKANLTAFSAADWPSYLKLLSQVIAAGGFFLSVLAISWVFGREFVDGTLKDMLAVPVARQAILLAKFSVVALWTAALIVLIFVLGLGLGALIGLPQGAPGVVLEGSARAAITGLLVIALVFPFALMASIGRGYLLPLGIAILIAVLSNLVVVAGWGDYFPWAVAGLYTQGLPLAPISFWIVFLTGLAGVFATYLWWHYADQNR